MSDNSPAAGWYADPNQPGQMRYWDGQQWTDQVSKASEGDAPEDDKDTGQVDSGQESGAFGASLKDLDSAQDKLSVSAESEVGEVAKPEAETAVDQAAPAAPPKLTPVAPIKPQNIPQNISPAAAPQAAAPTYSAPEVVPDKQLDRPSFIQAFLVALATTVVTLLVFSLIGYLLYKLANLLIDPASSLDKLQGSESGGSDENGESERLMAGVVVIGLVVFALGILLSAAYLRVVAWINQKIFVRRGWSYTSLWHLAGAYSAAALILMLLGAAIFCLLLWLDRVAYDWPFNLGWPILLTLLLIYSLIAAFLLPRASSGWSIQRAAIISTAFVSIHATASAVALVAPAWIFLSLIGALNGAFSDVSIGQNKTETEQSSSSITPFNGDGGSNNNQSGGGQSAAKEYSSGDRVSYTVKTDSGLKYQVSFTMPQTSAKLALAARPDDPEDIETLNWSYQNNGSVGFSMSSAGPAFEGATINQALKNGDFVSTTSQAKVVGAGPGASGNRWMAVLDSPSDKSADFRVSNPALRDPGQPNKFYGFSVSSQGVGFSAAAQIAKTMTLTAQP